MNYESEIYSQCKAMGMPEKLCLLIVAQSKHETNGYQSNVFKSCNNAFGYKYVGQRGATKCTGSPEGDNYAKYASVKDSATEIVKWIRRRQNEGKFPQDLNTITSQAQYAALLKQCGFYGQMPGQTYQQSITNYTNGLIHWFKDNIKPAAGGLGAIAAGILVFFC